MDLTRVLCRIYEIYPALFKLLNSPNIKLNNLKIDLSGTKLINREKIKKLISNPNLIKNAESMMLKFGKTVENSQETRLVIIQDFDTDDELIDKYSFDVNIEF